MNKLFFAILYILIILSSANVQALDCSTDEVLGITTKECIKASDTCGENCTYTIDNQGNLKIEGNGSGTIDEMKFRNNKDIINVDIQGIENIGWGAFLNAGTGGGTVKIDDAVRVIDGSFWSTGFSTFDIDSTNFLTGSRSFHTENITLIIPPNEQTFGTHTFTSTAGLIHAIENLTIQCKGDIALCAKSLIPSIAFILEKGGNVNLTDQAGNSVSWEENGYSVINKKNKTTVKYDNNGNFLKAFQLNNDGSISIYDKNGNLIGLKGKRIYTVDEAEKISKPTGNILKLRYK